MFQPTLCRRREFSNPHSFRFLFSAIGPVTASGCCEEIISGLALANNCKRTRTPVIPVEAREAIFRINWMD
jgi:hypothetical protein